MISKSEIKILLTIMVMLGGINPGDNSPELPGLKCRVARLWQYQG
jgi:hypothetical protein